jgi:leucyl aminopeptidase
VIDIVAARELAEVGGDLLIVPVFEDLVWGPGGDVVESLLGESAEGFLEGAGFSGKAGETLTVPGGDGFARVCLVGLGSEADLDALRAAAGTAGRVARRAARVVTTLAALDLAGSAEAVAYGFLLGQYSFDKYRSESKATATEQLVLVGAAESVGATEHAAVMAGAVALARDLVNEPAAGKAPAVLADRAAAIASDLGIAIDVYGPAEIASEGFGGLQAVALGAVNPARMVVMRYRPEGATRSLALVGKGIVFDSGGLSLKPAAAMETMKTDMAGAAAVLAATKAIAELEIPVNVTAITPLTENMPGGAAQRPGDVFTARNGKTVEVLNTDAEGRLVLADGLSLAAEEGPDLIVDVATLTGACQVALGLKIAGLFAADDAAAALVEGAAGRVGEKVWRLPLERSYRSDLDSPVADIKNVGERYGGAIIAALFLAEFAADLPWVHLDIAGPARAKADDGYVVKGATGFAVSTLIAVAEDLASA